MQIARTVGEAPCDALGEPSDASTSCGALMAPPCGLTSKAVLTHSVVSAVLEFHVSGVIASREAPEACQSTQ